MKFAKRLILGFCALACVSVLPSCSDKLSEKWAYNKEDITSFVELDGDIEKADGGKSNLMSFSFCNPLFTKEVDQDGLLFFDSAACSIELANSSKDYLDYDIIKNHLIKVDSIKTGEDLDFLQIEYSGEYEGVAGLVHKNYSVSETFISLVRYIPEIETADPQESFEVQYADSSFLEDKGGDLVFGLVTSIGLAIIGGVADSPSSIVFGILGIVGSIASVFLPSQPSIYDVLKKLEVIDQKLNEMMAKLDLNFNQLKDEELRTQTKVDKSILEAQTAAITAFQTDYVKPIDDFKRKMSVGVQNGLKTFVGTPQYIDVKLYKNEKGNWCYRPMAAKQDATDVTMSLTINSFTNSLAALVKSENVVTQEFMDALRADIAAVIPHITLPQGLDQKDAAEFAYSFINDLMVKNYFLADLDRATEMMNLAINLSKRYSGALGGESIVSTLLKRYEYFFNFAGEMRQKLIATIAKEMYYLDSAVSLAAMGCKYATINVTELHDTYVAGRNVLSTANKNFKSVKDGFSFILNRNLNGGGVYYTIYENWTTSKGQHPTYHYELKSYHTWGGYHPTAYPCDMAEEATKSISNLDHRRLSFRMNALKQINAADPKLSYIDYLAAGKVLSKDTVETIDSIKRAQCWGPKCNRFLTTFSRRSADSRDKGREVYCNDQGNPGGTWFKTDTYYKYGETRDWDHWSGEVCEGDFVDGITGELLTDKYMSMYAKYDEGHWYWKNDERWSFHSRPVCRFLILQYA